MTGKTFNIISLHPYIKGDINFIIADKELSPRQKELIKQAKAIILSQGCKAEIYWFCRWHCPYVFPNYDYRYPGEGKIGDALLWQTLNLPHPRTIIYPDIHSFFAIHSLNFDRLPFPFPFVLKGNKGGEGDMVYMIENTRILEEILNMLSSLERHHNRHGFIIQEFIPAQTKDLRVIIIGKKRFFFWRIQKGGGWKSNLAQGAVIDSDVSLEVQRAIAPYLDKLCQKTGINLAAIDILCPKDKEPLFLEINYFFGRRGLGGSERFYQLLEEAVKEWLQGIE
ncbi:MAG: glutathione synthase [Candidatus Desulfofervidaceae bacterium]|nr:glutathione synthase [Candidatus Desulfofervidaceae bacterium]